MPILQGVMWPNARRGIKCWYYNWTSRQGLFLVLGSIDSGGGRDFLYPTVEALDHAISWFASSPAFPLRARPDQSNQSKFIPVEFVEMAVLDEALIDAVLGTDSIRARVFGLYVPQDTKAALGDK